MMYFFTPSRHMLKVIGLAACAYVGMAVCASTDVQAKIYRCGNEYTNDVQYASKHNCRVMSGGNVTIVQTDKPAPLALEEDEYTISSQLRKKKARMPKAAPKAKARKVSNREQSKRDKDTRVILEAELKQAREKLATLEKDYNNGQPERWGSERNYQKYLDRVAKMRESIDRQKNDIKGLKREIDRLPSSATM